MKKAEYINALRELADYIEARDFPDTIQGYCGESDTFDKPSVRIYVKNKTDFGRLCAAMGSFEKKRDSYSTGAETVLTSGVVVGVTASREVVCKKIVVGTRTIEAKPEEIIPAEPEHEEEIVEWECPESFVALGKGDADETV